LTYDPENDWNDADNKAMDALLISILELNDAEVIMKLPENAKNEPDNKAIEAEFASILTLKLLEFTKKDPDSRAIEALNEAVAAFNSASVANVFVKDEENVSKLVTRVEKLHVVV